MHWLSVEMDGATDIIHAETLLDEYESYLTILNPIFTHDYFEFLVFQIAISFANLHNRKNIK